MTDVEPIELYLHPALLSPGETVQDGLEGALVTIEEPTFLLFIDLKPDHRYAHPTTTVFMGASQVHVRSGSWWSVIDGELHFPIEGDDPPDVVFPVRVGPAVIHALPRVIRPEDRLTDGPDGESLPIDAPSLVFWMELDPGAGARGRYIIVGGRAGVQVIDGKERPTIHGCHQPLGVSVVQPGRRSFQLPKDRAEPPGPAAPKPEPIMQVVMADVTRLKTDPQRVALTAVGQTPTLGWTNPRLIPVNYIMAPTDGIWDVHFSASPPAGDIQLPAIGSVSASITHTLSELAGFRIQAAREAFTVRVLEQVSLEKMKADDAFEVVEAHFEQNQLVVSVRYSGSPGHEFHLVHSGAILRSMPPQASLRLVHHAHGDQTEQLTQETLRFDLLDLPPAIVQLGTAFGFETTLRYRLEDDDIPAA